jgi:hypothetical protein
MGLHALMHFQFDDQGSGHLVVRFLPPQPASPVSRDFLFYVARKPAVGGLVAIGAQSLPNLIEIARFADSLRDTTAFFDFIHRSEIAQASYAVSLLRIIADPLFCETLVKRAP